MDYTTYLCSKAALQFYSDIGAKIKNSVFGNNLILGYKYCCGDTYLYLYIAI